MLGGFWLRICQLAGLLLVAFGMVAGAQYWFVSHELNETARRQLQDSAQDVREDIGFKTSWDLLGYRRTTWEGAADSMIILSTDGSVVDAAGFTPGMIRHVTFPFSFEFERAFRATSEFGEDWLFYVHRLKDGIVILGGRGGELPPNVETLIENAAAHFGRSIAQAMKVKERSIDEIFDYSIVDANGILRDSKSGIPLKLTDPVQVPFKEIFTPAVSFDDGLYAMLETPLTDASGHAVGVIRVYRDVTDERRTLHQAAIFNAAVVVALSLAVAAGLALLLSRTQTTHIACSQIVDLNESNRVEFKSSLRWDHQKGQRSKEVEGASAKAVAGFLNSWEGGTLIIGIRDDKTVLGLEMDYSTFESVKPDRDGFEQALRDVLIKAIGDANYLRHVHVRFCEVAGKEVCLVDVRPGDEAVYFQGQLYVRMGNATRPLSMKEAIGYASKRWPTPIFNWPIHLRGPRVPEQELSQ